MTSPQAMVRLVRRMTPPQPRIGFVTVVDVTNQVVTVAFEDGSTTTNLSWASSSYSSPTAGDRVLVIPTSTGWVVSSKVTPRPMILASQQAVVGMVADWFGDIEPNATSPAWYWYDAIASGAAPGVQQGTAPVHHGAPGPGVRTTYATVLYHGTLASLVPSGATIQQVTVRVRRNSADDWGDAPLAQPVMYGHAYTPGSPPTNGTAPAFVSGYGPLRFPGLGRGEEATLTVPPAWVTAWLAGTITGLGFYSTATDDHLAGWEINGDGTFDRDSGVLTITYTGGT